MTLFIKSFSLKSLNVRFLECSALLLNHVQYLCLKCLEYALTLLCALSPLKTYHPTITLDDLQVLKLSCPPSLARGLAVEQTKVSNC